MPTFRSLQEHCGRVIWLLEPGTKIGSTSGTLRDDAKFTASTTGFHERALRMRLLKEELLEDRLAAARKQGDTNKANEATADGGLPRELAAPPRRVARPRPIWAVYDPLVDSRTPASSHRPNNPRRGPRLR
jgi:hypothetical protein